MSESDKDEEPGHVTHSCHMLFHSKTLRRDFPSNRQKQHIGSYRTIDSDSSLDADIDTTIDTDTNIDTDIDTDIDIDTDTDVEPSSPRHRDINKR